MTFNERVAVALADRSLQTTQFQRVSFYGNVHLDIVEIVLYPHNGRYTEHPTMAVRYLPDGQKVRLLL
jgi:hypothetical protein